MAAHTHTGGHGHDHAHDHSVTAEQAGNRAFLIGIGLNLAFVLGEAIAGFTTGSLALITDAGHNLSDVASLVLSLLALRLARRKPSAAFTYGYKKTTILAALANAVLLLVAVGILGYESVRRFADPEPTPGGVVAWVAGIGIAVNGFSAWLFARNRQELNARSAYLHLLADALVSAGVVVAGLVMARTHWYWLDPVVSLVVLVVILVSTWSLLTDSLRLALDAVPRGLDAEAVQQAIGKVAGVGAVSHVHIWAMSTSENALTAHLVLREGVQDAYTVTAAVREVLKQQGIQHATLEIDRPGDL